MIEVPPAARPSTDSAPNRQGAAGAGPLAGLRVLELGQLIAGPFAGKTLSDLGADTIKIEPPGSGDPLRKWRLLHDGTSVWWEVQSRNKRSVAIDLRQSEGQDVVRRLVRQADVLIENFRPGTLEGWGLDYQALSALNPGLVMLRISGYGQTGPYKDRPGFGVVGEAMGGLRHLTGEPGRVTVRVGVSIGDTLSALHGTIGVLAALRERDHNGGRGQVVDVALYEAVFNCMESLADNAGRAARVAELDQAIADWTSTRAVKDALEVLDGARVPSGRIYTIEDIVADPQYRARDMLLRTRTQAGLELDVPGIVPKLERTPGSLRTPAPRLGQHTDEVLMQAGFSRADCDGLRARGVIQ